MQAGVRGRVEASDIAHVVGVLKRNAQALPRRTVDEMNVDAKATSPVDTGVMKDEHKTKDTGPYSAMQTVDVDYGVYVNFGTRNQAAQPWWSTAWAKASRKATRSFKGLFRE